jgi:hypothetical protein
MNLRSELYGRGNLPEATNDLPPMSAVLIRPALRTWKVAAAMLFAM